jgi:Na+/H+-dicarboxylate symporter
MVPTNVFEAAASNGAILSIIFFAIVFSLAIVATPEEVSAPTRALFASLYEVMLTLTRGILHFAPVGVFGYALFVTASTGVALVSSLAAYMATVAVALLVHAVIVLPLLLYGLTRRSPLAYARQMRAALVLAFSTASSSGTLPLTLKCAIDEGEVDERVASFTLPLGATLNMDGTALYEVVAVLFVAQMIQPLTLGQQCIAAVTALIASIGAAGIPYAGTVMMVIVMGAVGLDTEAVLVLLAVDRVLDMGRTTVNVWSDAVGAAVIDHFERRTA